MLVPVVTVLASVMLTGPALRWTMIIAAIGMFLFNVIGLPSYPGLYDKFLNVVGLGINAATAWYAWSALA